MEGPPKKYICSIRFETSVFSQSGLDNPDAIDQDLNQGSGGRYIYPVKMWTWSREEAVSQFAFLSSFTGNEEPPEGFGRLGQDLNQGAGGHWNYICIKKGSIDSPKVLDIDFRSYHTPLEEKFVDNWIVFPHDLNRRAKNMGRYIYMLYRTE